MASGLILLSFSLLRFVRNDGEGRYSTSLPNFITTTSSLSLYSALSEVLIISAFSKSDGCELFLSFGEVR
jgi:hypothetical protein